jgi:predicted aspartyl protease
MGLTTVTATVQRPQGTGPRRRVRFLVDSGALYSVLPAAGWESLRLVPSSSIDLALADGSVITRRVVEARFTIAGRTATSPVICGEERDGALLGAVTLETLRLMLNPLSREIPPIRLSPT